MDDRFPGDVPDSPQSTTSSRPLSSIPRNDKGLKPGSVPGSDSPLRKSDTGKTGASTAGGSIVEGKSKFADAAKSATGATSRGKTIPKGGGKAPSKTAAVKGTGKKLAGAVKNAAGSAAGFGSSASGGGASDIAGKALSKVGLKKGADASKKMANGAAAGKTASKKNAKEMDSKTTKLKKAGRDASKNIGKSGDVGENGEFAKKGIVKRAGSSIKKLGKDKCKVCGYQNGINDAGLCKTCRKKKRTSSDQVSSAEKAKNKAVDVAGKAGGKALGTAVSAASFGTIPPEVAAKVTEGFIGKGVALGYKFGKAQVLILGGVAASFVLLVGFIAISVVGGGGGGNIQAAAEQGSLSQNTSEIPAGQFDAYFGAAKKHQVPWSILAGVGSVTTEHGTSSPYDEISRPNIYPFVTPAIVGETGRGPILFNDEVLTDGVSVAPAPGGGTVLDPSSLDLSFERQPGRLNPGGELLPATVAARDFIEKAWPNNPITSDWRPPDGYNHHYKGEALDIGCKGACTSSDIQRLNIIAAWFAQNPEVFGVSMIIWEQRSNTGNGWIITEDQGDPTQNHFDHIHLNFTNPGRTSLGPVGNAWAGSSLSEVSANTKNSPYKDISADEDNSGESTVPDQGANDTTSGGGLISDESSQDYAQEVERLAVLVAEARDIVYDEKEDFYTENSITKANLSENPFRDDTHVEFWEEVLTRLPIDFENIAFQGGAGSNSTGSNVILGDDVEAVVSQLVWAKRWIESSNNYNLVNSYGYKGAYQYGDPAWGNFKGYPQAHLAPPEIQDEKMANDYRDRLIAYENDVKKAVQHHLCPADAGNDDVICEFKHALSDIQVNPDLGTYWACSAVLLNALPGNEGKYSYRFTSAPAPGVETYERNCKGRIPAALQDPKLPSSVRESGDTDAQISATEVVLGQAEEFQIQQSPRITPSNPEEESEEEPSETEEGAESEDIISEIDLDVVPVDSTPKEKVFALASLQEAARYSGLEVELIEGANGENGGSRGPGVIIDGNPSAQGFIWPTSGVVTSGFGMRWGSPHKGIDIAPPRNTPVVATKEGVVDFVFDGCGEGSITDYCGTPPFGGYGNVVFVKHEGGFYSLYAHLEPGSITVEQGQRVVRGQQVGGIGSSGNSSGPHLHFEIRTARIGGELDPMQFMPPR